MLPACFHLADDVFPRVRAVAAKGLVAAGWSQSKTAGALGVSQAMVSKYIARQDSGSDPLVLRLADDLVDGLTGDGLSGNAWCTPLATHGAGGDEALQDLLAAEQRLLEGNPIGLVPEIGLNIARALPGASQETDVLSYPGRLVAAGGRIVRPAPPDLDGGHLARCLVALRQRNPARHALANIKGTPEVAQAARQAGLEVVAAADVDDTDDRFIAAATRRPHADAVHDAGSIGMEPCLYVVADDAATLLSTLLRISEDLP